MSCTGAVASEARHARGGHRRDRRHADHRARRDARRRPRLRGGDGGPQEGGLLLSRRGHQRQPADGGPDLRARSLRHGRLRRRRQVDADRPPALRHQVDLRGPARARRADLQAARRRLRRTWRCSPTACAPSASRASRSTSPTATSPRRGASSSSPTRPATSSTRATWSPGASTADLALVLVDARKGVLEQSRRHAFIASLLRIPHLVVCVNKMDLVDFDEARLRPHRRRVLGLAREARHPRHHVHPDLGAARRQRRRALASDALVPGPSLLYHLEHVHIASDRNLRDARFPVQWVMRPMTDEHHDYRGYAGQVAAGVLRAGDEVVVLPSGRTTRIAAHRHLRRRSSRRPTRRCR